MPDEPTIGFAASWGRSPERTWSGTPWSLMQALRARTGVVDLGVHPAPMVERAFKAASVRVVRPGHAGRRHQGRLVTTYKHSPAWRRHGERTLRRALRERPDVDVVVEIGDLAVVDRPFLLYQDFSYDTILDLFDDDAGAALHFPGMSRADLERNRDRQLGIYEAAAGLLTMSRWLAGELVARGVPAGKVHVVPPGVEAVAARPVDRPAPRRRLLFVGRDFRTKAGDVVVEAFTRLRRTYDPALTLTVAGPAVWPGPGAVPDGVDFLGPVSSAAVADLYARHDLLVMPSRLEGFGKVFAEARSAGLPAIGRRAFAMPELITPGVHGDLVDGDDPDRLAEAVVGVLGDDGLYARCAAGQADDAAYFTWARAADDVLRVAGTVSSTI